MKIYIGCSGYYYPARVGKFYPSHIARSDWLRFYAQHFNAIEINNTFYKVPTLKALQKWFNDTPTDFSFILKVPKVITHEKKLQGIEEELQHFADVAREGLQQKLKAFLFQLPPSLHYSEEMLQTIISLPHYPDIQYVYEFRHASRRREEVMAALAHSGDIFCSVSYPSLPDTRIASQKQYIRLHGVPVLYKSAYGNDGLKPIADHIVLSQPDELYVLFNNTRFGAALDDIPALQNLLEGK